VQATIEKKRDKVNDKCDDDDPTINKNETLLGPWGSRKENLCHTSINPKNLMNVNFAIAQRTTEREPNAPDKAQATIKKKRDKVDNK
jgi:hypothetical protein